jgi:hypothetical protein
MQRPCYHQMVLPETKSNVPVSTRKGREQVRDA